MNSRPEAYDLSADHALNPLALPAAPARLHWRFRGAGDIEGITIRASQSPEALSHDGEATWSFSAAQTHAWIDWPTHFAVPPGSFVWWKVRPRLVDGSHGDWSETAVFGVAPALQDWRAQWITHSSWTDETHRPWALPNLGHRFTLSAAPRRAVLYVTATGVQETFVNGRRVGGAYLEPGYSNLDVRVAASAWDVTELLHKGTNDLRAVLGTGIGWVVKEPHRYSKLERKAALPRYMAQIVITAENGATQVVSTDDTWSAWLGENAEAHWYGGQDVLAERVQEDPERAVALGSAEDFPPPWFTTSAPVRVVDTLQPVEVRQTAHDSHVLDFGVNFAGQVRGHFPTAPAAITFRPSEMLDEHGAVNQTSTGSPIFDRLLNDHPHKDGAVDFAPSLTYHGFRYLEVEGLPEITPQSIWADVLRADLPRVGRTATSSEYLNRLLKVIDRAVQSNMFSVFTDCPHREKLGWIEQLYLCFGLLSRGYDIAAHLRQALTHIRDAQQENGMVPTTAPEMINFSGDGWRGDPDAFRDDPNWGAALVLVPWRLYCTYADRSVLEENWSAMQRYANYLRSREVGGLLDHGLGDWIALDTSTPRALVATAGYIVVLDTLAQIAATLTRTEESMFYAAEAERARGSFVAAFREPEGVVWGSGSQASLALALDIGVVENREERATVDALVAAIRAADGQISVGENALPALLRQLSKHGYDHLIHDLIRQEDGPGYGYQLASGATALTESWQGPLGPVEQASQNHFMLGMVSDWITDRVCGLKQADDSIGWQKVIVEPTPVAGLDWAETEYLAPSGRIETRWTRDEDILRIEVTLPPGVTGELRFDGCRFPLSAGTNRTNIPDSSRTSLRSDDQVGRLVSAQKI